MSAWSSQTKGLECAGLPAVCHVHLQIHFLLSLPCTSLIYPLAAWLGQWEALAGRRMGSWPPSPTPTLPSLPSLPCGWVLVMAL